MKDPVNFDSNVSCPTCKHKIREEHGEIGDQWWCAECDRPCDPTVPNPLADVACPGCGEKSLELEWLYEATQTAKDLRFSLAGAQMKFPVQQWPYLVCQECNWRERASA